MVGLNETIIGNIIKNRKMCSKLKLNYKKKIIYLKEINK